MNVVELSKSSRAKCKQCKLAIDKAITRYGEEYEFRMGGETRSGMGWYHFDCAIKTRPENVAGADIGEGIPQNILEQIKELKKKTNRSAFTIIGISELVEDGKQVNCKGTVLRMMKPLQGIHPNGHDGTSKTIYVQDEDTRRKIILWDQHVELELIKGDQIVVLKGFTDLGSDEKIQINAISESEVYINPSDEELADSVPTIEIFVSNAWERSKGSFCLFEYAKTSRAACVVCNEKILKGELKIIKPIWAENEKTKQLYPGNRSFHLKCVEQDEHGSDVLLEAISRLDPDLLEQNREELTKLLSQISDKRVKSTLKQILGG